MEKFDIIQFKTMLLNRNVEDIGIIENVIQEDNEILYQIRPFNLKIFNIFILEKDIILKIGTYKNFDFTNDESNHNYKIGNCFYIQLNDNFYNRFLNELGYFYWNNINEMKEIFKDLDMIECKIVAFQGPQIYHIETKIHDIILSDKLIDEFKL